MLTGLIHINELTPMTRHTSGPWTFHGPRHNIHVCQAANPDWRICFMTSDGPTRENARLIAAAPDMLAELQRLLTLFGCQATADVIAKATKPIGIRS